MFSSSLSLEHAHCTVVIKADEPTAVHLPGSRHIAPVPEGRLDRVAEGSSLFFAFSYLLTPFLGFMLRLTRTHVSDRLPSDAT